MHVCVCVYLCIYVYVCICMYVCMYVCYHKTTNTKKENIYMKMKEMAIQTYDSKNVFLDLQCYVACYK